jgi:hypothetical protein
MQANSNGEPEAPFILSINYEEAMHLIITDIEWDTDGMDAVADCGLPTTVIVLDAESDDEDYISNEISEQLSDNFGFCHEGFQAEPFNQDRALYHRHHKADNLAVMFAD